MSHLESELVMAIAADAFVVEEPGIKTNITVHDVNGHTSTIVSYGNVNADVNESGQLTVRITENDMLVKILRFATGQWSHYLILKMEVK